LRDQADRSRIRLGRKGDPRLATVPSIGRAVPEADLTHALYERYANQIYRYCLHQLGSREEAEDAVQSTFLNAFRGIRRGIVPVLESAWLFTIAHNVCRSRRRSTWRRDRIESPAEFDTVEELTPAPALRADELIGLRDVLGTMPESQRRAILLREWQGLSYREIAHELDLSPAAVETLIFRARRSLARGLEQPEERRRRRVVGGLDLGNLVAAAKSLLVGGSAVVKVGAAVALVGAGTVAVTAPARHAAPRDTHPAPVHAVPATATVASRPAPIAPPATRVPAAPANVVPERPKPHVAAARGKPTPKPKHGAHARPITAPAVPPGQAKKAAATPRLHVPPGRAKKQAAAQKKTSTPAKSRSAGHRHPGRPGNPGHGPNGKGE
jgi:RNA polymerase sigma factor (sigma-70 family)